MRSERIVWGCHGIVRTTAWAISCYQQDLGHCSLALPFSQYHQHDSTMWEDRCRHHAWKFQNWTLGSFPNTFLDVMFTSMHRSLQTDSVDLGLLGNMVQSSLGGSVLPLLKVFSLGVLGNSLCPEPDGQSHELAEPTACMCVSDSAYVSFVSA